MQVVYDGVGAATWRGSMQALAPWGSYMCFGQASGVIRDFTFAEMAAKSARVTCPVLYHFIADPAKLRSRAADLFDAVASGKIRSCPRQRLPLTDAAHAHADLENRRPLCAHAG